MTHMSSPPFSRRQNIGWYLTLLTIFLMASSLTGLCFVFYLSSVPDITWQHDELSYTRVFLAHSHGPAGIGIQTQKVTEALSDGQVCVSNRARYYLWKRAADNPNTQSNYIFSQTAQGWQSTGQSCP